MKKIAIVAVALLSAFVATPALADNSGKFYVAGDLGSASFSNANNPVVAQGGQTFKNPGALRIAGGYHISPMLAVEAGYLMLGDSTINYTNASFTSKNTALQIAAVGTFAVAPTFDLIGKLGMSMNSNKLVGTGAGSFINSSTSSTSLMFGIGAQYNVNKQVSIRVQYEDFGKFKTNDGPLPPVTSWDMGVSMFSVGVAYNF